MAASVSVKVSSRYQVAVPQVARKKLSIRAGDRLLVDVQDGLLILLPEPRDYVVLPCFQAVFDNSPAAWRGADGRLWFSTRNGLLVVSPGEIRDNPSPPPVLLTQVRVDDQTHRAAGQSVPVESGC